MFPGLHVSVENTANAECTFFFFFYFIGIKAYGRFLFLIHNTGAYRASHSGGRAKTHGFCLKFARGEEG